MSVTESLSKNLANVARATAWVSQLQSRDAESAQHLVLAALSELERGTAPLAMDSINAIVYSEEQLTGLYTETLQNFLRNAGLSKQVQYALCQVMSDTYGALARLYHRFLSEKGGGDSMTEELFVLLTCRALLALGNRAKWASFRQEQLEGEGWRLLHKLYQDAEERGLEQRSVAAYLKPKALELNPAQAYARTLLLATLASGAFNQRQMQTSDEWLIGWCAGARLDQQFDRHKHFYYVDLAASSGARRVLGASSGKLLRFLSTDALSLQVERAKMAFRQGQVNPSSGIDPIARAGEYAELLDKIDRIWSPEWMRSDQRSHRRVAANNEPISVVRGLEGLSIAATEDHEAEQPEATGPRTLSQEEEFDLKIYGFVREQTRAKAAQGRASASAAKREAWQLLDESVNGYGAALRADADHDLRLAQLVGVKRNKSNRWAVGYITRRLVQSDHGQLFVGIEVLSHNPVVVTLTEEADAPGDPSPAWRGLFIPGDQGRGRADSLIVDAALQSAGKDFTLAARNVSYYVRLPRVIRKGQGWQRVAFEVLAKRG
jgi:hypothetical protein